MFEHFTSQNWLQIGFDEEKLTFLVQHNEPYKFGYVVIKEQLTINFGKYLFGAEKPFRWEKVFFMTLRSIFQVFQVKLDGVGPVDNRPSTN